MASSWKMKGTVLIACSCDYGCPCNFNALPTQGKCEGQWTWLIDKGDYGGVDLSGLPFTLAVKWPGAIHEGNGEGVLLVDERATEEQRRAIHTLVLGGEGGPWGVLGWTWPTLHGPEAVHYELELNGLETSVKAGETLELAMEPIRNPVSGAQVTPSALLPQGIVTKHAEFASSRVFRVGGPLNLDHSGKYSAVGPFDYSGP